MTSAGATDVATFLFTDIEESTRLWDDDPDGMRVALAHHDALARSAVAAHRGTVVKMLGDGMHAAFADPLDGLRAALVLQRALAAPEPALPVALRVRCGLHWGAVEKRADDYFGSAVNRAARIMSAAHGGQVLVSAAVAEAVAGRLRDGVELIDLGRVRLRGLAAPEHVYQVADPVLRREFPPLRSLESTPHNLPQQLSSFIGRERESAEIRDLLTRVRLLTLHGAGGLGKTRLSLHVAATLFDAYPDGVWLVELAPIADGSRVTQAIATVLGVKDEPGRPLAQALIDQLRDRRALLILDNCEHLGAACATVARDLLRSTRTLTLIATSREPLRIAGEATYQVSALSVPAHEVAPDMRGLESYDAIKLFSERARAADPGFALTPANAAGVIDVCRRLDGIALAIELAAARVRALGIERVRARLADRFSLLTRGDATAEPRQQTLRALIDWSYDLLDADERALFRRLAVFAGSWTLESAEAVCADSVLGFERVLDVHTQLVEKSLIAVDADGSRYRLLETIREYAQARLDAAGESGEVRGRHLRHYVQLAEIARPQLVGPEQGAWMTRLDHERENLIAAHGWCAQVGDGADLDLRLVSSVKVYWANRGLLSLGYRLILEALQRPGAERRTLRHSRGLTDAGQLGFRMGAYREVKGLLEESLSIARELNDERRIVGVLQPLGMTCLGLGDLDGAREHLREAHRRAADLGDAREFAAACNALAQMHRVEGALDDAAALYRRVVELARTLNDPESIAIGLLNLAMVSLGREPDDGVRAMLIEVVDIAESTGSSVAAQSGLDVGAALALRLGDFARAARFVALAEALGRQSGLTRDPPDAEFVERTIEALRNAARDGIELPPDAAVAEANQQVALREAREWLTGR